MVLIIAVSIVYLYQKKARYDLKKHTFEQILATLENREGLSKVLVKSQGLEFDSNKLSDEEEDFRNSAVNALNYCEYLAVGIHYGVLDEEIIKASFGSSILLTYVRFGRFIKELRMQSNNPETFRYFSQLADKWRFQHLKRGSS